MSLAIHKDTLKIRFAEVGQKLRDGEFQVDVRQLPSGNLAMRIQPRTEADVETVDALNQKVFGHVNGIPRP
jgi:hypothetical protein